MKMVIVDEKYAVIGGTNIAAASSEGKYLEGGDLSFNQKLVAEGSHDMDCGLCGSLVLNCRREYYKLWNKWAGITRDADLEEEYIPLNEGDGAAVEAFDAADKVITCGKEAIRFYAKYLKEEVNSCRDQIIEMIGTAKKTIKIGNMMVNQGEICRELAQAGNRGVKVEIITNGNGAARPFGAQIVGFFTRYNYYRLLPPQADDKRINIWEYSKPGIMYHKKVMVIDGEKVLIGSFNLSVKSVDFDDECFVVINSREAARQVEQVLEEDKKDSIKIEHSQARKFHDRWFSHKIKSLFFHRIFD